jgi:hypothetical protein
VSQLREQPAHLWRMCSRLRGDETPRYH